MDHKTGMNKTLLTLALLGTSLLATGCKPDAQEPVDATALESKAPSVEGGPVDAVAVVENSAADAITADSRAFDSKGFAGVFSGTLPCASCPGIDTSVELNADGSFVLTETYLEEAGGPQTIDGTWTVESDGKRLLLDPNVKQAEDRRFAIVSNDEIRLISTGGSNDEANKNMTKDSKLDYSLKRGVSAQ